MSYCVSVTVLVQRKLKTCPEHTQLEFKKPQEWHKSSEEKKRLSRGGQHVYGEGVIGLKGGAAGERKGSRRAKQ